MGEFSRIQDKQPIGPGHSISGRRQSAGLRPKADLKSSITQLCDSHFTCAAGHTSLFPPLCPAAPYLPGTNHLLCSIDRLATSGTALRAANLLGKLGCIGVGGGPVSGGSTHRSTYGKLTNSAGVEPFPLLPGTGPSELRPPWPLRPLRPPKLNEMATVHTFLIAPNH